MSLKHVMQVKADRGFRICDIIVYAVVIVLIVALFIALVFTRDSSPISSVSVTYGYGDEQRTLCTYNFLTDSLSVYDYSAISVKEREGGLELTFSGDDGDYNVIFIDRHKKRVSVTSANCPSQDCVFTPAITDNSSLPIICSNHRLIVQTDYVSGSEIG